MENISPALLEWFYKNRRSLPFREDPTPYHVWLSEVMLQQTRVSAVLPYYYRFLEALPDIPALAACEEEKLHKLWEGLGYYSRVRNLQKAAKLVCAQYGGQLPADYAALLALPGIGELIGGSQREEDYGKLVARMDELGMDKTNYEWYLNLRKFGGVEHAGYGLGFERMIMYLTGIQNIRDVLPFPRTAYGF